MSSTGTVHPHWFNPAMPAREDCVVPALLERAARADGTRELLRFENGNVWSAAETLAQTRRAAAALQARGVGYGDMVLAWLPNGPDMLRVWFAANWLGAIVVPINTAYRGRLLEHVIKQTAAKLMVADAALVDRLGEIERGELEELIVCGSSASVPSIPGLRTLPGDVLTDDEELPEAYPVQPWDTMMVIFTSGTTGPSKGVLTTYLQQWTVGQVCFGYLGPEDCMLVNLPLFHVGGTTATVAMLAVGGRIALFDRFQTTEFWKQVRATGATSISGLLGAMIAFLDKNPPSDDDGDNPLRRVVLGPISAQTIRLAERYRFDYLSGFNMSEVSVPLITDLNTPVQGSCGRPRSGVECRIVDDFDRPVAVGEVGELIVRTDLPWSMNQGYLGMPEATVEAWRNGWFHTGDLMRCDAQGNYYFVDRKKDSIRRRGENISSMEVELEVIEFPAVAEAAVYAAASEWGEDEVMVAVAAKPGALVDPSELLSFLLPRMPHFMLPRYVRILDALPKTPTNKIQKHLLRAEGVTGDTWDREAAGWKIKRS